MNRVGLGNRDESRHVLEPGAFGLGDYWDGCIGSGGRVDVWHDAAVLNSSVVSLVCWQADGTLEAVPSTACVLVAR